LQGGCVQGTRPPAPASAGTARGATRTGGRFGAINGAVGMRSHMEAWGGGRRYNTEGGRGESLPCAAGAESSGEVVDSKEMKQVYKQRACVTSAGTGMTEASNKPPRSSHNSRS